MKSRRHRSKVLRRRRPARMELLESRRVLATFFVDTMADHIAGECVGDNPAANNECTLRLAISEAAANPGADTIQLPDGNYLIDPALGNFVVNSSQDTRFIGNVTDAGAVVI
ncbi:MAG: hypothetical protein MI861_15140, partial [Pirellulales bacterium]|nr:hypothetical protein [Pirellulales bacterium]